MQASDYSGPGPQERKLWSRIHFKVFGRWPASVVDERLYRHEMLCRLPYPAFNALFRELHEQAGHPVPPEYR